MKRINFLTNAMIPGTLGLHRWDATGRCIKDITLTNSFAIESEVSEMLLNVTKFSAIDQDGAEHFIADFPGQRALRLHGIASGRNIRSRKMVELAPSTYETLRFYLAKGSVLTHSDRSTSPADIFEYLDFEIEGSGLELKSGETAEIILRFDFVPFKPFSALKAWARKVAEGARIPKLGKASQAYS